jgi:hypothetical protein
LADHKKFTEAKKYLVEAAMSDPNHEVKAKGKIIRLIEEEYAAYDVPADVKAPYKSLKKRHTLEVI